MNKLALPLLAVLASSGCASTFHGTARRVEVSWEHPEAVLSVLASSQPEALVIHKVNNTHAWIELDPVPENTVLRLSWKDDYGLECHVDRSVVAKANLLYATCDLGILVLSLAGVGIGILSAAAGGPFLFLIMTPLLGVIPFLVDDCERALREPSVLRIEFP